MTVFRYMIYGLPLFMLTLPMSFADDLDKSRLQIAEQDAKFDKHHDPIEIDPELSLTGLVDLTLSQYPDILITQGLVDEADALAVRGDSWVAGSNALYLNYNNDTLSQDKGYQDGSVKLEFTPWFWGQRTAAQNIANEAHVSALKQSVAIKLEVTRQLREALWDMALAENRLELAKFTVDTSKHLKDKVQRRVELGDLARTDLLLAETEYLQNLSLYNQSEAELMHTRKNYTSLTRISKVPAQFQETLSTITTILPNHPLLEAINALIARKQATIEWAKTTDTINQPKFNLGSELTHDPVGSGNSQTAGVGVVIPFGHETYDAPEIANAHLELNRVLAQREHLQRMLEKNLHEAEHALELTREQSLIAKELKQIAETHLKMIETSFAAGDINLLDLIKIQTRSFEAIRNAKEQEVKLQRYIAMYNQAVGVMP